MEVGCEVLSLCLDKKQTVRRVSSPFLDCQTDECTRGERPRPRVRGGLSPSSSLDTFPSLQNPPSFARLFTRVISLPPLKKFNMESLK